MLCLALLPTVSGNCGAGILLISLIPTHFSVRNSALGGEITITENGEVKALMVFIFRNSGVYQSRQYESFPSRCLSA